MSAVVDWRNGSRRQRYQHDHVSRGWDMFAYDANGALVARMMAGISRSLTYDSHNRLVEVADGGAVTSLVYDGAGGRVARVDDVTATVYVGDGF